MSSETANLTRHFDSIGEYTGPSGPLDQVKTHNLAVHCLSPSNERCSLCAWPMIWHPKRELVCIVCRAMLDALIGSTYFRRMESYAAQQRINDQTSILRNKEGRPLWSPAVESLNDRLTEALNTFHNLYGQNWPRDTGEDFTGPEDDSDDDEEC